MGSFLKKERLIVVGLLTEDTNVISCSDLVFFGRLGGLVA